MGICVVYVLLVASVLFGLSATRVLPVLRQEPPRFKGYGDSSRPSPFHGLHVSERASVKFVLRRVEPEYPHEAKTADVEGDVVFRIIVGTDGRVQEIHLRRGAPFLIEAAARALSKWQYKPYMFNGNAVEFETFATVRFRLPRKHQ